MILPIFGTLTSEWNLPLPLNVGATTNWQCLCQVELILNTNNGGGGGGGGERWRIWKTRYWKNNAIFSLGPKLRKGDISQFCKFASWCVAFPQRRAIEYLPHLPVSTSQTAVLVQWAHLPSACSSLPWGHQAGMRWLCQQSPLLSSLWSSQVWNIWSPNLSGVGLSFQPDSYGRIEEQFRHTQQKWPTAKSTVPLAHGWLLLDTFQITIMQCLRIFTYWSNSKSFPATRGGGGRGGTPIYFLYRDVPTVRVSFSGSSVLNRVYNFTFSCLKQGHPRKSSPFLPLRSHNFRWFRAPLLECVKTQT